MCSRVGKKKRQGADQKTCSTTVCSVLSCSQNRKSEVHSSLEMLTYCNKTATKVTTHLLIWTENHLKLLSVMYNKNSNIWINPSLSEQQLLLLTARNTWFCSTAWVCEQITLKTRKKRGWSHKRTGKAKTNKCLGQFR